MLSINMSDPKNIAKIPKQRISMANTIKSDEHFPNAKNKWT